MKQKKVEISGVAFLPMRISEKGFLGFASCKYGRVAINNIGVYSKPDGSGVRCLFASKKIGQGREIVIAHPVDQETTRMITEAIQEKVKEVYQKAEGSCNDEQREVY